MIVLGIDPGISNPGVAVLEVEGRVWRLADSPVASSRKQLIEEVVYHSWPCDLICYEQVTNSPAWGKSGHGSAGIVGCEWLAETIAEARGVPCIGLAPSTWRKRLTGSGRADKAMVERFVRARVSGIPKVFSEHRFAACGVAIAGAMGVRR